MELICINDNHKGYIDSIDKLSLTINKIYYALDIDNIGYKIKDDNGNFKWFYKGWFRLLSDYREDQINKICFLPGHQFEIFI